MSTLAAALSSPGPSAAQTVVGRVVEHGTLQPLEGVFVVLVTEGGRRRNGVLTGRDGRYVLPAAPGRVRVMAELIGHATALSDVLELDHRATRRQDLEIRIQPVTLEGIQVETDARCRLRPGAGEATARVWDEARKALEVARWSDRERVLRFLAVEFDRDVDSRTGEVMASDQRVRSAYSTRSIYNAIPADSLAAAGYVQGTPDGTYAYFAPDADVLLSDSFLDSHCFVVRGAPVDEPGLIGLGFEPLPGRALPDVEGVLWLDRSTAELRRLDFTYRGLPYRGASEWRDVGGRVEFARLSTGVWIVERWVLRMPLTAIRIRPREGAAYLRLAAVREHGAAVRSVRTPAGDALAAADRATLYGVVVLPDGTPVPGARIELMGTARSTVTGVDGGYRISRVDSGSYLVRVSAAESELAGLPPEERTVTLAAGRAERLPITLPFTRESAERVCRKGGWRPSGGRGPVVVYGTVVDGGGAPRAGALLWLDTRRGPRLLATDTAGAFRGCVEASGAPATLHADADWSVRGEVPVSAPGFVRADLVVSGG